MPSGTEMAGQLACPPAGGLANPLAIDDTFLFKSLLFVPFAEWQSVGFGLI